MAVSGESLCPLWQPADAMELEEVSQEAEGRECSARLLRVGSGCRSLREVKRKETYQVVSRRSALALSKAMK